jgi:serine/threonine protein phosphatase PrpC
MRLRYAALSDVGRVRRDNQDAGYAGPHLLVIADGVGGAARGDVASSLTVEVLRQLDRPPGEDMLSALAGAIHRSHDRIAGLVREQPEIEGTSTTVTAAIFDGATLGVGHVGDSRGYLLRDGSLSQLTTDHTFVQSLIDEGRITEDEARVHPHRNLILRAVDGVHEPEPDVFTIEVAPGDRIMLCSDGCSGVLPDAELARLLGEGTPDHATVSLVSASLDAGSSDNVTVVVADLVDDDAVDDEETSAAAFTGPMLVGAAAESPRGRGMRTGGSARPIDTSELEPVEGDDPDRDGAGGATAVRADDDAGDAADLDEEDLRYAPRPPRRFVWARRVAAVGVVVVLATIVAVAAYQWSQGQYYVADDADQVVIFRGVQADIPGVRLHRVEESGDLALDDLPTYTQRQVRDGISATSLDDARGIVSRLERLVLCPEPAPATPDASGSPSGDGPSASASERPREGNSTPSPTRSASPSPTPSTTSPLCTEAP